MLGDGSVILYRGVSSWALMGSRPRLGHHGLRVLRGSRSGVVCQEGRVCRVSGPSGLPLFASLGVVVLGFGISVFHGY